jgi:hypothetical protein
MVSPERPLFVFGLDTVRINLWAAGRESLEVA